MTTHGTKALVSLAVLSVLIIGAGLYGCGGSEDTNESGDVTIVEVSRGNLITTISSLGTISLPDQAELTFGSNGKVAGLMVEEGETVMQGQRLAKLDSASLASIEKAVVQAEIDLQNAQEALELAQNPYGEADIAQAEANAASAKSALETAVNNLEDARNPYTRAEIAGVEASVAEIALELFEIQQQAPDEITNAEAIFTEEKEMFMNSIFYVPYGSDRFDEIMDEWERAQLTYDSMLLSIEAKVNQVADSLEQAQELLEEMRAGADPLEVEKREKELIVAQDSLTDAQEVLDEMIAGPVPSEVRLRELDLIDAQAVLEEAQEKLEAVDMVAPFDGIVNRVNVDLGDDVTANQVIIHLVNQNVVEVDAAVDEIDVANVGPGLMAMITIDALPNAMLRGQVKSVATLATSQSGVTTYDVVIKVMNAEGFGLKAGMSATIEIISAQAENVLLVPTRAVSRSGMRQVVQVVTTTGQTEERVVETGETNGTMTEIISGLAEGERVAVSASANTTNMTQQFPGRGDFPGGFPGGGFRMHD